MQDMMYRPPVAAIVLAGFIAGFVLSFGPADMLGRPPMLLFPAFTIAFSIGVLFLAKPKLYVVALFLYYGFYYNGVLIGKINLPIPYVQLLDELFLAIPVAVICMTLIGHEAPKHATLFPALYLLLAFLSFKVNAAPTVPALRITLAYFKFYIYWYFMRCIAWSDKERKIWIYGFAGFVLIQFLINIYWHRGITMYYPDAGQGTIGDQHIVGYLSAFALFFMGANFIANRSRSVLRTVIGGGVTLLIAYNLIFLTDTKHVLFLMPIAALPFLTLFPRLNVKQRVFAVFASIAFVTSSYVYLNMTDALGRHTPSDYVSFMRYSGKGQVFHAIKDQLPREITTPLLGAGPGNFCSSVGVRSFRPLANKYVLPHVIRSIKSRGGAAESSVIGSPETSFFTLWGEFGILNMITYYAFWGFVMFSLWKSALGEKVLTVVAAQRLALVSCLILNLCIGLLRETFTIGVLMVPIWALVGMFWNEPKPSDVAIKATKPAPRPRYVTRQVYGEA